MSAQTIYKCSFDGACEPMNPGGNMGIGAVIYKDGELLKTHTEYIGASPNNSNNVAEYKGFLWVLDTLLNILQDEKTSVRVEITGDSNLVVMQMTGRWKIKKGLYASYATMAKGKVIKLTERADLLIKWIPGHTNTEADKLSRQDIEESNFLQRTEAKERKYNNKQTKNIINGRLYK